MTELVAAENPEPQKSDPPATEPLASDPQPAEIAAETNPQPLRAQVDLQVQLEKQQKRLNRDKLQGTKLHRDAEAKNALKLTFSTELNKLDNLETRETAVRAIKTCLEGNINREALKLFLSILGSPKTQSAKGRCAELRVLQMVLKMFSVLLLENGAAGLNRVYSTILAFFSDRSREVQESVGECMCSLYECSLGLQGNQSLQFILEPLTLVLTSGTELNAQQTAAVTLRKWICSLPRENTPFVLEVARKVIEMFLKLRPGYPDMISTIGYLLQNFGIEFLVGDLLMVIRKLLGYFGASQQGGHFGEREACKLLAEIYRKLGAVATNLGDIKEEVITRLKTAKSHRVAEVQREAAAAFLLWSSSKPVEKPQTAPPRRPVKTPVSTTRLRTMRDIVKQRKAEELSSPPPPEDQWGVYKPKFLTRGSGRYVPNLGYGKLDLSTALKTRPSIKDFIKTRGRSVTGRIEIFSKSPTEANRIVPRSGYSESPEADLRPEDGEFAAEEEEKSEEPHDEVSGEILDEEADAGEESQMQAFQVEAPIAATEAGNPNSWNRMRAGVKKPTERQSMPVTDPQVEELPQDERQSLAGSSQKSSGRLKKMVGKSMAMQTLLNLKGGKKGGAVQPSEPEAATEVQPAKEKYNSSAVFKAFGKSVLQKMTSRSAQQDSTSPKSTIPETQTSAPATLERGMPLHFFSPLVSARLKAASQATSQATSQAEVKEAEPPHQVVEESERDEEELESPEEEEAQEMDEMTQKAMEWIEETILREIDSMQRQFDEIEATLDRLDEVLKGTEAKVATRRRMIRAQNSAPPKYKSHIHPPVPLGPKPRASVCDSEAQTRAPTTDSEAQTSSLALYKIPGPKKPEVDVLSRTWLKAMAELKKEQTQPAYRRILRTGDDVYLLRLMATTGPVVDSLNMYTMGTLLGRLSQLLSQSFIPGMMLDWIEGSVQTGVFFELGKTDQQLMMDTVQSVAEEDTEDGWKARSLYEYLTSE